MFLSSEPPGDHEGADLTDTMMVLSVDAQKNLWLLFLFPAIRGAIRSKTK